MKLDKISRRRGVRNPISGANRAVKTASRRNITEPLREKSERAQNAESIYDDTAESIDPSPGPELPELGKEDPDGDLLKNTTQYILDQVTENESLEFREAILLVQGSEYVSEDVKTDIKSALRDYVEDTSLSAGPDDDVPESSPSWEDIRGDIEFIMSDLDVDTEHPTPVAREHIKVVLKEALERDNL